MSKKIKNGGLDQYGTEHFGRLIFATVRKNVGMKVLNYRRAAKVVGLHSIVADLRYELSRLGELSKSI